MELINVSFIKVPLGGFRGGFRQGLVNDINKMQLIIL
jgi:hypothetical protein